MSWWQGKLFPYALRWILLKSGFFDEETIDVSKLDLKFGRQNVIDFKDVGFNIAKISKLAQLPPSLRIETARILSLRLIIDLYRYSITAEIDGVEVVARLASEETPQESPTRPPRPASPIFTRTPQHRKTNRRIHSPPPFDPGALEDSDNDIRIPTTEDLAKSFLQEEPLQDRRELEVSVAGEMTRDDQSTTSDSSEGEVGVGVGVGVPGFLSNWLQNVMDRVKISVRNVQVKLETDIIGDGLQSMPITLRLRVGSVELNRLDEKLRQDAGGEEGRRTLDVQRIVVDILSDETILADPSEVPSQSSTASIRSEPHNESLPDQEWRPATASTNRSFNSGQTMESARNQAFSPRHSLPQPLPLSPSSPLAMRSSVATVDTDHFADASDDVQEDAMIASVSDIRPGDDNISWGSRRSQASAPAQDLWRSMISQDEIPDSMILQPDRVSTPRALSSRGSSPFERRQRRAVSPYDRGIQSPGSWRSFDESPERRRLQHGPGSWPALDQSNHSAYEPLAQVLTAGSDEVTDNKRSALQQVDADDVHDTESPSPPEPEFAVADEMLESRVFSHEEAESMYMSAMSGSPTMAVPGGWGADTKSDRSPSPVTLGNIDEVAWANLAESSQQQVPADMPSGNITPRAQTPRLAEEAEKIGMSSTTQSSTELLFLEWLTISLPGPGVPHNEDTTEESQKVSATQSAGSPRAGMPGTFSAYSEMSSSRLHGSTLGDSGSIVLPPHTASTPSRTSKLSIMVGSVAAQMDIPSGRLVHRLAGRFTNSPTPSRSQGHAKKPTASRPDAPSLRLSVEVESTRLSLQERIVASSSLENSSFATNDIITINCADLALSQASDTSLHVGDLAVLLGGRELLSFNRDSSAKSSHSKTDAILANVSSKSVAHNRRPVTEIAVNTIYIHLTLDLTVIEETFGSFGGLSGMLEIGNSIMSESGTSSPIALKAPKGVRFAGETQPSSSGPVVKFNGRVSGITAILRGTSYAAALRTSTLKAVYREHGVIATVDRVRLNLPFSGTDLSTAPISVDLASLRAEYLLTPQDKDLERLISLLTPSNDKYDNDDDILIDTLLRQRRKGALLRIAVGDAKVRIDDWECISALTEFGNEFNKLSAVTKYLPEDERPGLLTLARIKKGEVQLPVNERFGNLRLSLQDLHLAHVRLPALLTFSIGNVGAAQVDGAELLHQLVPLEGADNSPVVMARMLGDEEEPTVKIKLFNTCVEYSVPVIVALTSVDEDLEAEEMVNAMAESMTNLVAFDKTPSVERSPGSDMSKSSAKRMTVDLLIHDSAIGLMPQKLESKALFVLSDAGISSKVPPEDIMSVKLELRKAALFVTDQVWNEQVDIPAAGHSTIEQLSGLQRVNESLRRQGYVSVGTLMAASISLRAEQSTQLESQKIEVDVTNELLLLETCADSTQTLITILGGLAPPSAPSKIPKYQMEPAGPIEDLVNSMSGEPVPVPTVTQSVLYDVDENVEEEAFEHPIGSSMLDEPDDILAESSMAGSLYGPVGGIFGMEDDHESGNEDDFPETAESLLEEDPFEMTNAEDVRLGDAALMRDLTRQCKPALNEEPVDLGQYEIEDLGYDALGTGQQALGNGHRFNAPFIGRRSRTAQNQGQDLPVKLRVRDFNVIWHLHDGYDWERTRNGIAEAVEQVEQRAEERRARRRQSLNDRMDEESVIGDFLFNSIYIGVPSGQDAQELRRQINRNIDEEVSETASIPMSGMSRPTTAYSASGQPRPRQRRRLKIGRSKNHKISFDLKGVAADVLVFPPDSGEVVSSIDLRLKDFEIFDKVPTSTWRKFLTHMTNDPGTREMSKPMFHIQIDNVKTLRTHSATEIRLHVSVLPLRLHVDQDALDFITRFFEFKPDSATTPVDENEKAYIQRVEVEAVDMRLDYKPKNVDYAGLRSGKTTEFMNFITLEGANIRLQHAITYGVKGFEALHPALNNIWMPDIQRNQLPTILAGLAPMRSLVNIGSGVRDVIAIPIREYKKDGRILRSIQKGTFHFGKTTTSELARLGAKVALGTQTLLSTAEDYLSPSAGPSSRQASLRRETHDDDDESEQPRAVSAYANQPVGVFSGLRSARRLLEHDLLTAKDALIAVQGEFLDSRGPGDLVGALGRHAPTVILRPVIGGMRAVGTTLLGVGNQIDREGVRRGEDKYKPR